MFLLKDNVNLSSYHGCSDEEEEKEQQVEGYLGKTTTVQIIDQLHIRASVRNVSPTLLQKFSSNEPVGMVNTDFFTMMSIHHQQGWDGMGAITMCSYRLFSLLNCTVEEERAVK